MPRRTTTSRRHRFGRPSTTSSRRPRTSMRSPRRDTIEGSAAAEALAHSESYDATRSVPWARELAVRTTRGRPGWRLGGAIDHRVVVHQGLPMSGLRSADPAGHAACRCLAGGRPRCPPALAQRLLALARPATHPYATFGPGSALLTAPAMFGNRFITCGGCPTAHPRPYSKNRYGSPSIAREPA